MPWIRNAIACVALGSAVLFQSAYAAPPPPAAPPAQWAEYIAQVKAADAVQGDEARCKAHPDLPGNQWRPGAAQGRCTLLRAPAWTLDQIDALLAADDGAARLERDFATLLDAHYRDQAQREQIFIAFSVFDKRARAGEVAQRWLKAAPNSPFAMVAAANHFNSSGWQARGTRWASETSERQFDGMTGFFAKAVPLYVRAMELEPRLSVACNELNAIGRQSADALQIYATSNCLKVDPDSYYVVLEQIDSAKPKWGGSDAKLHQIIAYAAARTDRNPIVGALLGEAAGYAPSMADRYGAVVDELAAAASMGPSGTLMANTGSGYWSNRDFWRAIAYYSQALRFWPNDPKYRNARARLLAIVQDVEWARSDIEVAVKLAPENTEYQLLLGQIVETQETPAAARPYFKKAMSGEQRQHAMERYCATFLLPTVAPEADSCTRGLVEEFPESPDGWFLRAWAITEADVDAAFAAAQRFKALASPENPRHRTWLENVKTFEAMQKSRPASPAAAGHGK